MKKVLLVLVAIIIGINLKTQAEDFSAVNNGATIYYEITSSSFPYSVSVSYRGSSYDSYSNEYSGVVIIPDSVIYNGNYYTVTSIGDEAFEDCTGLTSITIPNSITSIGSYAFLGCSELTSITIPNSITSIGSGAFYITPWYNNKPDGVVYINNILYTYKGTMPANTTINIQAGTVSISSYAFMSCSELISITIPNSVTSIGDAAFSNCSGLTSITIGSYVTSIGYGAFSGCTALTSITIPSSVTSIDGNAFIGTPWYNNKPNGVVYINNMLYNYKGIMPANTTINIQPGTISVCGSAFYGCIGLTSIIIPNSVTSIGGGAFSQCSGLTSITIPNSVTSIGGSAFYGCTGLTSITIGNSVTSIGDYTFYQCYGLTSITIPNSVTLIGNHTFENCSGLTSINIPNSVTAIGNSAFYGCIGLTSIIFPTSITSIGDDAFASCRWLTSITCAALIPPIIWSNTFRDVEKTIPVFIPIETKSAYQTAPYWSMFSNFIEQEISIPTSIFQEREFKLYPNPTSSKAILEVEGLKSEADVLVLDLLGRVIKSYKINPTNNELEIDVNEFAKGVYNIRIMNDSINQTKKLIVQ